MSYALAPFEDIALEDSLLDFLIEEHETIHRPRLDRLWMYYRNALAEPTDNGASSGSPGQAAGLPSRLISGTREGEEDRQQREIVIENDIAWRIHTLVDFMFPSAPKIISRTTDPATRELIEDVLDATINASGEIALWQDASLLGSIYGSMDFLVNCADLPQIACGSAPSKPTPQDLIDQIGSHLSIETIEAPRAIPLMSGADYRQLDAYIIHYRKPINSVKRPGILARLSRAVVKGATTGLERDSITVTEIYSATRYQRYHDGQLVDECVNRLGRLPIVHIQNLSQPYEYGGWSDVEPLIPLQDELNTRLSDRANRVTMQSFQMWLGKGVDGFDEQPVGPGQMWVTDNLDASIESFGGDADSPSERAHLEELREALDKASGVTPAAAGHIKARVGNLTSENALRISLMGTVAKINRKRVTFDAGIRSLCELILHALDVYGVLQTDPSERQVEIVWSDALPVDETRNIQDALAKAQLGIAPEILRAELGYPDAQNSNQQ